MGLDTIDELRSFCLELSNDKPSPGGGTASAAAGAMAASLLTMVCEITMRSKKHAKSRPELMNLMSVIIANRDELVALSLEDAQAYDQVVDAAKEKRADSGDSGEKKYQRALRHACEVPQSTAAACLRVLEAAVAVAGLGLRSASSDVGVAIHLARAGLEGAMMNVRINLDGITDLAFVKAAKAKLDVQKKQGDEAASSALALLAGNT